MFFDYLVAFWQMQSLFYVELDDVISSSIVQWRSTCSRRTETAVTPLWKRNNSFVSG